MMDDILDTALRLAGEKGWDRTTRADIAAAAGVSADEMDGLFPGEQTLIAGLIRRIDRKTVQHEPDGTAHDRLFDAIMTRLEALQEQRSGFRALVWSVKGRPTMILALWPVLERAMAAILEQTGGTSSLIQIKALTGLYLSILDVWFRDENADLSRTMAVLDRRLSFLHQIKVLP
ncbi:MAG: TetR family transcriptional regulator [Pseudomonadota bacterium]|nr:TetR family transcriptional regulator [Pseudomonadota bacterium]